jgi:hypothetical protein
MGQDEQIIQLLTEIRASLREGVTSVKNANAASPEVQKGGQRFATFIVLVIMWIGFIAWLVYLGLHQH